MADGAAAVDLGVGPVARGEGAARTQGRAERPGVAPHRAVARGHRRLGREDSLVGLSAEARASALCASIAGCAALSPLIGTRVSPIVPGGKS